MSDSPENPPISLYGIKNCDTIKKARRWLEDNAIPYRFHDYRVDGLTDTLLQGFIEHLGWESLLNTRGTTWRKLDEAQRAAVVDAHTAKALMLEQPAIIKRPVLEAANGGILLGFKPESYQQFFAEVR
ncbi:ArsC family transcriptional regulator [Yersinia entomophaga]|uniref:ArsC family transcriptional regulator n=1 Tax=Yersinia entomophaga TaxID=935293 RepID=A0ABN4PWB5_YERET|nr:ArsC family reductase [Yersinia entomophaga]ANI31284.1 ArsC family transcriptional regulator [Yersinia entomophaga]OWF90066.1 ArsC family reductase [Yersinia entomophaga]